MTVRRESRSDPKTGATREYWRMDIRFRHPDGRRERIKLVAQATTKRDAEAEERKVFKSLEDGTFRKKEEVKREEEAKVPTVAEFADTFVDKYARANNKPSEVASKESALRLYVVPAFGAKRLDEVGPLDIDGLKVELLGAGLKAKTVANVLLVVSRMFGYAVEVGHIERPPRIKLPKYQAPPFDYLSFEEADLLLATAKAKAPDWYGPLFVTLRTGLRRGELFELRWGDVQLKGAAPHLRITRSVSKGEVGTTKSSRERIVYLTPATAEYLGKLRQLNTGLVFPGADGGHMPQNTSDANLRRLCRLAELREIGWHVMRHTFASHLAMRGVPLKVIQEQLGHATMQMTMRYAHLSPASVSGAVAVLDEVEGERKGPQMGHGREALA